jgi:hypothetical protein
MKCVQLRRDVSAAHVGDLSQALISTMWIMRILYRYCYREVLILVADMITLGISVHHVIPHLIAI